MELPMTQIAARDVVEEVHQAPHHARHRLRHAARAEQRERHGRDGRDRRGGPDDEGAGRHGPDPRRVRTAGGARRLRGRAAESGVGGIAEAERHGTIGDRCDAAAHVP